MEKQNNIELLNNLINNLNNIPTFSTKDTACNADGCILLGMVNYLNWCEIDNFLRHYLSNLIEKEIITDYFLSYKGVQTYVTIYICLITN